MRRSFVGLLAVLVVMCASCKRQQEQPPVAPAAPAPMAARPPAAPGYGGARVATPAAGAPAILAESIPDLPDYPGATKVFLQSRPEGKHGFTRKLEARFTSTDPFASVVAHYQKAIAEKGWTVVGTEAKSTEMKWKLTKGPSEAEIEVEQKPGLPLQIKLEREDR
jgi:hypothetical protein